MINDSYIRGMSHVIVVLYIHNMEDESARQTELQVSRNYLGSGNSTYIFEQFWRPNVIWAMYRNDQTLMVVKIRTIALSGN